mmetsp:Transcript_124996/g.400469  ORF Transcript_124996/g.400469 Transcript_124996/m.400469 type:complete len:708 (+) Transcript_124996:73-2196(+)
MKKVAPNVTLSVRAETTPGTRVYMTGSLAQLGAWNPLKGPELFTDAAAYPKWSASMSTEGWPSGGVEYKFVIIEPDGTNVWEERANRSLTVEDCDGESAEAPWFGKNEDTPAKAKGSPAPGGYPSASAAGEHTITHPSPLNLAGLVSPSPLNTSKVDSKRTDASSDETAAPSPVRPLFRHRRCASVQNMASIADTPSLDGDVRLPLNRPAKEVGEGCITWRPAEDSRLTPKEVKVVFEASSSSLVLPSNPAASLWSLDFAEAGVNPGMHIFHFLVDGVRMLSSDHLVCGSSNVGLFNANLRKYVFAQSSKHEDAVLDAHSPSWGRAASTLEPALKPAGMARPYSIGNNLSSLVEAAGSSDEEDNAATSRVDMSVMKKPSVHASTQDSFSEDIYDGLFDGSLRLRMHGLALPADQQISPDHSPMMRFCAGTYTLAKPSGLECEDACFADEDALGVADGVGSMVQFARFGVNSAAYATDLMETASAHLRLGCPSEDLPVEERALAACVAAEQGSTTFGASTIVVCTLAQNTIGVANLGDSGFMLLRRGSGGMSIIYKSAEQQHGWNCPYQLMRIPAKLAAAMPKFNQDHATDAESYTHTVAEGDLMLLFSDGVRDNLFDSEILGIVDRALSPAFATLIGLPEQATPAESVARAIARAAQLRSLDTRAKVPFTVYSLAHGYDCLGGKEDDVTVVAAWVVPQGSISMRKAH